MRVVMKQGIKRPVLGVLSAVMLTAVVILSGLGDLAALALLPLLALFWFLNKYSQTEMGFVWGRIRHYGLGLLHPVLVLSLVALIAWLSGVINIGIIDWPAAAIGFLITTLVTIVTAVVTEEGFFRGWLWAALKRSGFTTGGVVVWSSIAWALWHLPVILLGTGLKAAPVQIPIYILSAVIIGVIWGFVRLISGSVIVASVVHGIWNGAVYVFFGFGAEVGVLGIQETSIFGPEVGVLGLILNLLIAIGLWQWYRRVEVSRTSIDHVFSTENNNIVMPH